MTYLHKYRLLSFVVWNKNARKNSFIYKWEKKYLLAKKAGISVNTFSKYLQECISLGIVKRIGEHYQFISLSDILFILFSKDSSKTEVLKEWKFIRFWKGINITTIKDIYEKIQFGIARLNYKRQEYKMSWVKNIKDFLWNRIHTKQEKAILLKTLKMKKYRGMSFEEIQQSIREEIKYSFIKSGKFHVANLLGCSSSAGTKRLSQWVEKGWIERKYIYEEIKNIPVSKHGLSFISKTVKGYVSIFNNKWIINKGSQITLLDSGIEQSITLR